MVRSMCPFIIFIIISILPLSTSFTFITATKLCCKKRLTTSRFKTSLSVFEFFKDRVSEGFDQLQNIQDKGLLVGIKEAAEYTSKTNEMVFDSMAKSRVRLLDNLDNMFTSSNPDILTELEDVLLQADLGLVSTDAIMEEVKSFTRTLSRKLTKEDLISVIRSQIISAFASGEDEQLSNQLKFAKHGELTVFFVMGANGMGKTTSIGKLAHRLKTEGNQKVLVAACDTFRAGAYQQLKLWADRAEVDCYGPKMQQSSSNSNVVKPATVLYESLDKALRENYDTLIVDTSGRLSNNAPLTAELVKMKKIIQKKLVPEGGEEGELNLNVPHETILVIDAAQGRMALDSARKWNKDVGVSSLILTKLDGTAKGGSIVGVRQEVGIPVKLIGVGEGIEDLRDFDPRSYADGLLGIAADKVDLYDARILALEEERKKIVANIESNKRK